MLKHFPKRLMRVYFFFIVLIGLLPSITYGLAGIAERSSQFHYNNFAKIDRGHPSDICSGVNKWCLAITSGDYQSFKGVDSTFEQINVPPDTSIPYIIGQRSNDDNWAIYDLQKEQFVISDFDYKKVVDVWYSLGLTQPKYVNARNTRQFLIETDESVTLRWKRDLQMWLFLVILPVFPVAFLFWYLSEKSKQKYKKNSSIVHFLISYALLLPVLYLIYISATSLLKIIQQNW